jgi:hypothetical protein
MNCPKLEVLKKCKQIIVVSCLVIMMIIGAGYAAGIMIPINAQTPKTPINAQTPNPYSKSLTVYLTIFGINSTTSDVLTFVKAHDIIKNSLFNATKLDMMDNKTDGIAQTSFSFPNLALNAGEPFTVCILVLKDAKMICTTDFKTPSARPQFVDMSLQ